ncbi:12242_t:CDS:2 [Racocetra fulgida]|uniref:12242_t:CDS:1 n=1 Tax=Racocetra fulgida TaxID=60492 RepID=A0A9N8VL39_9GLOM|nr:12242_t:CDS:2 [Racocetra fulgida]
MEFIQQISADGKQFPEFKGKVIKHGDADYEAQSYQYASSSYLNEGIIQPAVIIKAADDSDVIKAIKYARGKKIAVAVRTGGHQFSGASSTNGKNIQLDLSQTYKDFKWDDEDYTMVTFGISITLGEFNAKLREKNRFVPHGQCQYVNMGGHIQTGGYGQLGRSFGLLSDHVIKFRFITANGQVQWVRRNIDKDKDLFFAVLGGSPGNFGVLTHVTLDVYRDEDYPNSRGLKAVYPYSRQRLKALLDIMVEMVEDENFPADYDYCVTVIDEPKLNTKELTYDMIYNHGSSLDGFPPLIFVFVQWANLQGYQQNYNSTFIDKIQQVAGKGLIQFSDKEHIPMSTLTGHWIFTINREFKYPYIKRVYASNSSAQRLKKFGWTDWVTGRIEDGAKRNLKLTAQFQHFGGINSRFYQNGKNSPTSFSWRDSRIVNGLDAYYHAFLHKQAIKWQQGNEEEVGNPESPFCEQDHRFLWGSFDLDLSAAQQYYYDQQPEGKYDRLCNIKKHYDPLGVFTPNRFCICLPPLEMQSSQTTKREVDAMKLKKGNSADKW